MNERFCVLDFGFATCDQKVAAREASRTGAAAVLGLSLFFGVNSAAPAAETSLMSEWTTASPEEVGFDSGALTAMFDYVREHSTPVHSVQIVRYGKLVLDSYFYPYRADLRHDVASVTKSITSTLVGLAIEKGCVRGVKEAVVDLFPNYSVTGTDARKKRITLEHLLTMQAGWDCGAPMGDPKINVDPHFADMRRSADWVRFVLELPMIVEPGQRFAYCNANCHLLSALIAKTTGTNTLDFARRELFEPLGIRDVRWPADPQGNNYGWGDLQLHPQDMARIGQLFLNRGRWNDRQVVSERWISEATRSHVLRTGNNDQYGYFWWMPGERYPGLFEAIGRGGQRITIWPAKQLVLVFTGGGFNTDTLTPFIIKALKSDKSLPENIRAAKELRERMANAAKPPSRRSVPALPVLSARLSGKDFKLSTNTLGLSTLALRFNAEAAAEAEFTWDAYRLIIPIGLDGVPRFSLNPLLDLPQAAKGEWLDGDTFVLELDLVGGINYYRFELTFSEEGKSLKAALSERTGLNDEQFQGVLSR